MTPQTIHTASESAQRIASRYVPADSQAMKYDEISAVVYTYPARDGRPAAIAYKGTARKPAFSWVFGSDGARQEYVCKWVAGQQESVRTRQAEQLAKREETHTLTEGEIVVSSWGYEQTNVDFYQVVRVISPKTVVLRQIGASLTNGDTAAGAMSGYKVPQPGAFLADEPEMRCRARGTHVTGIQRGGRRASLWNGKPQHCSWYA